MNTPISPCILALTTFHNHIETLIMGAIHRESSQLWSFIRRHSSFSPLPLNAPNDTFSQPESTAGARRDCDARNCFVARTISDARSSNDAPAPPHLCRIQSGSHERSPRVGGRARPIGDRRHQASTECDSGAGKRTLPVGQADTAGTRGRSRRAGALVLEGKRRRDRQTFDIA